MRLINADKLVEYKASGILDLTEWQKGWNDAIDTIMGETPTVDAVVVRHGYWVKKWNTFFKQDVWHCDVCEKGSPLKYDYCPNCGAKMDRERKEDGHTER